MLTTISISSFAADTGGFTPAQQKAIGQICGQYIVKNPQVLVQASQALQQQQMQAMEQHTAQAAIKNVKTLLHNPMSPTVGNPKAKVALIEFYDYQCSACHHQFPVLESFLKDQPDVLFIAKQFPIFAQRWKASEYAAEMAFVANKQGKFYAYHNAIYGSNLFEGKLTVDDVNRLAKKVGVDTSALSGMQSTIKSELDKELNLAGNTLGLQYTPTLIIMPNSDHPKMSQITVFFGAVDANALKQAVKKAGA